MNKQLFKPLNEQMQVVKIKQQPITEADVHEAKQKIIFGGIIAKQNNEQNIAESETLDEAFDISKGRHYRKQLYKLKHDYDTASNPQNKEKALNKIRKLQNDMEKKGYNPNIENAVNVDGAATDKKLAKYAEDYHGATNPVIKAKALDKYQKRSDLLAKRGKPSVIPSMQQVIDATE